MKRGILLCALFYIFSLTYGNTGYALKVNTHRAIDEYISGTNLNSFSLSNYLNANLGFTMGKDEFIKGSSKEQQVYKWLSDGGQYEDEPPWSIPFLRSRNHFHNPLFASNQWGQAGFTGFASFCDIGQCPDSAILWAQGPQNSFLSPGGDWSWSKTRDNFYNALTSTEKADRDISFADTFRGLGQIMHLVQDMSVPEHTRNSFHAFGGYEGWVVANAKDISLHSPQNSDFFAGTINNIPSFFDTDQYTGNNPEVTLSNTAGLSEYTNVNFFSRETIFSPDFPNPKKENTNAQLTEVQAQDGKTDQMYYIHLNGQSYKLAAYSYFVNYKQLSSSLSNKWLYHLDNQVYSDYAKLLLPRTVGYSSQILNYFFRGQIEAVNFAIINGGGGATLKIKNNTPGEAIEKTGAVPGKIVVSYQYKQGNNIFYGVSNEVELAESIASGAESTTEYTFTFPGSIPFDAQEIKYWLVFRGRLGNEDDAVAANIVGKMLYIGSIDGEACQIDLRTFQLKNKLGPSPSGATQLNSAATDEDGFVYYMSTGGNGPYYLVRYKLQPFELDSEIVYSTLPYYPGKFVIYYNGFIYVGGGGSPYELVKIDTSTFEVVDRLTLGSAFDDSVAASAVVSDEGYLFYTGGTNSNGTTNLHKVDLNTFSLVGTAQVWGEGSLGIDNVAKRVYVATNTQIGPQPDGQIFGRSNVMKFDYNLSLLIDAPSYQASPTAQAMIINDYLYISIRWLSPEMIVRKDKATLADAGMLPLTNMYLSFLQTDGSYLYAGLWSTDLGANVAKIDPATLTIISTLPLPLTYVTSGIVK